MAGDVDHTKREKLLLALLAGENNSKAAESSGYSRKHVKEMLRKADFVRELERRRAAQVPGDVPPADLIEAERLEKLATDTLEAVAKGEGGKTASAMVSAAKEMRVKAKELRGPKVSPAPKVEPNEPRESSGPKKSVAEEAAAFGIRLAK